MRWKEKNSKLVSRIRKIIKEDTMVKEVIVMKRGNSLTGRVYEDNSVNNGNPYYAEVDHNGELFRSPYYNDEDVAVMWIEDEFERVFSNKQ